MKIAFISNVFPPHVRGGYELGAREIVRSTARLGHDVVVLTSAATGRLVRSPASDDLPVETIFEPVFAFESDLADLLADSPAWCRERTDALGGFLPGNMIALSRALDRFRPDVVWMFNPVGLGLSGILETPLCHKARRVVHLMDDVDHYARGSRRALSWEARYRRIKQSWNAISCSSITKQANETIGAYRRHVVVPNGIRFGEWAREEMPVRRSDDFRFVYFGQVDAPKGILELVRAFSLFRERHPAQNATLDIIGRGSDRFRESIDASVVASGLGNYVRLVGFVDHSELRRRLADYDAAVMLLRPGEPFGYAPLEALAAGLPTIVPRNIGFAEFIPRDYPLLVEDRDDPVEVAGLMAECISKRARFTDLATGWRNAMLAACDLDRSVVPRYLDFVRSIPLPAQAAELSAILSPIRTCDDHESWQLSQ